MADLIDRQAAIKAILKVPDGNWSQKRYAQEIRKLPSVDSVPVRRGKWIHYLDELDGETTECSVCHVEGMLYGNYCPNCGALMV